MVPTAIDWVTLLLKASGEAESSQRLLAQAARDYAASPSQRNRERLDKASRHAWVKESEFEALRQMATVERPVLGRRSGLES